MFMCMLIVYCGFSKLMKLIVRLGCYCLYGYFGTSLSGMVKQLLLSFFFPFVAIVIIWNEYNEARFQ